MSHDALESIYSTNGRRSTFPGNKPRPHRPYAAQGTIRPASMSRTTTGTRDIADPTVLLLETEQRRQGTDARGF